MDFVVPADNVRSESLLFAHGLLLPIDPPGSMGPPLVAVVLSISNLSNFPLPLGQSGKSICAIVQSCPVACLRLKLKVLEPSEQLNAEVSKVTAARVVVVVVDVVVVEVPAVVVVVVVVVVVGAVVDVLVVLVVDTVDVFKVS